MNIHTNLETLRHSAAHILAAAVLEMFPEAKFGVGPATENGFYYDFELPRTLIPEDLPLLEERMKKIISANHKFELAEISEKDALEHFKKAEQSYKIEIISDLIKQSKEDGSELKLTLYKTGTFVDLCTGPHVASSGKVKKNAFALTKISGAYWKGDASNKQMQRIYGVVFESKEELDAFQKMQEEALKRDHKKLGKELDLFSFHSEAPGMAFWHPNGMIVWNELEAFGKSLRKKYGNQEIQTPQLAKNILWKTSGHWDHYKDDMFSFEQGNETYCLKPMDCPFNIKIYQTKQRSYKELPMRFTEIGRVMRNEKSGELNGLLRVRGITQDDAHIFVTPHQVLYEITQLLKMIKEYYAVFNMKPNFFLSTRPDDFMGEIAAWDKAEKDLKMALDHERIEYGLKEKDGAFYGPKIDINIDDALGRSWQLATIQLDFQLPERFKLEYVDSDGSRKMPVIIHAAVFGSLERFIGIFLEHTGGNLPTWLSPIQASIIPVSEKFSIYAKKVARNLKEKGIRVALDDDANTLGKRISEAEKQKIPYILIIGEREENDETVTVRTRGEKQQKTISLEEFAKQITLEIAEKK